jgi:adenine-specific DNA-methyltransferase
MSVKPEHTVRRNGIYYTPAPLAKLLIEGSIRESNVLILDPACGEGALLKAAATKCQQLARSQDQNSEFHGCDKLKHNGFPNGIPNSHFIQTDFLRHQASRLFNVIVMNPPFLANARIAEKDRRDYRTRFAQICDLEMKADIWAYFLLNSVSHLRPGGGIGAILPWSFLQAEYAANIRKWLAQHFRSIKVLVLTDDHFQHTTKRVLLVWLEGYGESTSTIELGFSEGLSHDCRYEQMDVDIWQSKCLFRRFGDVAGILNECLSKHGFIRFGDIADVKIGIVTGANKYFILPTHSEMCHQCPKTTLVPIITSSKSLKKLTVDDTGEHSLLLKIPAPAPPCFTSYLRKGRRKEIHKRSHSIRREPWYRIDVGRMPDAFFHYRVSLIPFLALNTGGFQSTNSIHRVYFRAANANVQRWAQISLLSTIGQLSLEASSKVYGNGILKVEPSSLNESIVYFSQSPVPDKIYRLISSLILSGRKAEAVAKATQLLREQAGLPKRLLEKAEAAVKKFRQHRL